MPDHRPGRPDIAALEALHHRQHAEVEDRVKTLKATGAGHLPFHSFTANAAWPDARRTTLHLPADWPWAGAILRAFKRLDALPAHG